MESLQWAIGILVTIDLAVTGFLAHIIWTHIVECRSVSESLAAIRSDVERMKADIGTHDTGMRGEIHKTATMCTQHELRLTLMERGK